MAEPSSPSPREFLDKLRKGTLTAPVEIVGMVQESDENDELLQFSVDCASWTSIPIDMVEAIESLGVTPCKDHTHHAAIIRLKEPQSDEARVFARLLGHLSIQAQAAGGDWPTVRCRVNCYSWYRNNPVKLKACLDEC